MKSFNKKNKIIIIITFCFFSIQSNPLYSQNELNPKNIIIKLIFEKYDSCYKQLSNKFIENMTDSHIEDLYLEPVIYECKTLDNLFDGLYIFYYDGVIKYSKKLLVHKIDDSNKIDKGSSPQKSVKNSIINSETNTKEGDYLENIITKDTLHYAVTNDGKIFNLKSKIDLQKLINKYFNKEDKYQLAQKLGKLLFYSYFDYYINAPQNLDFQTTLNNDDSYYSIEVWDSKTKSEYLKESRLQITFDNDSILEIKVRKPVVIWTEYK